MKNRPRILIFVGSLLLVAIALQIAPKRTVPHFLPPDPMAQLAPAQPSGGWQSEERELGDTESMREQVKDVLGYDDAFFRVYRRGGTEVGVYMAYWRPGQIDPADAATHSPDLCWVNAGWTEESHDYAYPMQDGAGQPLKIAQHRVFTAGGSRQEVVFWHLMGGRISGYALGPSSRWDARLPILWSNMVENHFGFIRREQFFIRISTNRKMSDLVADPLWREIIAGIAPTGLREEALRL
jgi:Protein of unknown function (DUF3485)